MLNQMNDLFQPNNVFLSVFNSFQGLSVIVLVACNLQCLGGTLKCLHKDNDEAFLNLQVSLHSSFVGEYCSEFLFGALHISSLFLLLGLQSDPDVTGCAQRPAGLDSRQMAFALASNASKLHLGNVTFIM